MTDHQKDTLLAFSQALIDQEKAKIIVYPLKNETGFWFGSGNLIEDENGTFYLCGRYRNSGDSRTGTEAGVRGAEIAVFKSEDRGKSFEKILSFQKKDLGFNGKEVVSIERCWLFQHKGTIEFYISTEKSNIPYPKGLESYQKPGTGVWTIDRITADRIEDIDPANIESILEGKDSRFYHFKDPFCYYNEQGDTVMMFSTHPFNWASSNTGLAVRKKGSETFTDIDYTFFPRGFTWDVAISRLCGVLTVPKIGVFSGDETTYLYFYDGGECMRNFDEHQKAVKRPRGYSCEEIGGAAYTTESVFPKVDRLTINKASIISPYGTGCSRYMTTLETEEGYYSIWEQSQKDLSQPLVMHFLSREEAESILS